MANTFELFSYVVLRMKKCGIERDTRIFDSPERVLSMAKRALSENLSGEKTEELDFLRIGDSWATTLRSR